MDIGFAITAFATLFVIIDPIGLTPMFVALTQGMTAVERRKIAIRACLIAIGILATFGLAGEALISTIGISLPAFRISGGILLLITAIDMLFERRTQRRKDQADTERQDPSVFPLAMPLIAGAGAMAAMILLTDQAGSNWQAHLAVHGVMVAVVAICFLLFQTAGFLERILGQTGINVVTRLLGMLLAALAVQFVLEGLRDFGFLGTGG